MALEPFTPRRGRKLEERHLVAAVKYAAYIVLRYGDVYAPTFERLEDELSIMRKKQSASDRARQFLESYTFEGELKAIR